MFHIKELERKEFRGRTKIVVGINERRIKSNDDYDLYVVIDDNKYEDLEFPMSFSTFLFVNENAGYNFVREFVENFKNIPMIVGTHEPTYKANCYRTLVQMGKTRDFSDAATLGGVMENITLEEMKNSDYKASILDEFKHHLLKAPEME